MGVKTGIGVGALPTFMGDQDSSLERFNDMYETSSLWLIVHPEVQKNARIRVLISFLNEMFFHFKLI